MNKYWDTLVFPLLTDRKPNHARTLSDDWPQFIRDSLVFCGYDPKVFGEFIIVVKEDGNGRQISTASITRFGTSYNPNLMVDARSRFWPACENLLPQHKTLPIRRALAITALKNYSRIINSDMLKDADVLSHPWDETDAGNVASDMKKMTESACMNFGQYFLERGVLQRQSVLSCLIDVIYDNETTELPQVTEQNNKLVSILGEQLDQIFDPLLEYSPEEVEIAYSSPPIEDFMYPPSYNNPKISSVVEELVQVQRNFCLSLVKLLQDLIIPLRIHVLSAAANCGIQKINRVFPPTIDEVTRINCILQDSLHKAAPFGYVEVTHVLRITIPYFYKALIRHEANMKHFLQRLNTFFEKNHKAIFENRIINKGNYTLREIDAIVSGSLVQLPRLRLIIKRMQETIIEERSKTINFEQEVPQELAQIQRNLDVATKVIDAFGLQEDTSANVDISQRIFTPTGKILTELASNWPAELQYGWLSRKVVGIFEVRNLEPLNPSHYIDVLVIFSDKILLLTVTDDDYYHDGARAGAKMKIADILLHSLVNGKPLPEVSSIASMQVSSWCDIDLLHITSHSIMHESKARRFIQLTGFDNHPFESKRQKSDTSICNFELLDQATTLQEISDLINKSKILYKNQPFHLFRSFGKTRCYLTAHNIKAYNDERCRSTTLVALNSNLRDPETLFQNFRNVFLLFQVYFTAEENIAIEMRVRDSDLLVVKSVKEESLAEELYALMMSSMSDVINSTLLRQCQSRLQSFITAYRSTHIPDDGFKFIQKGSMQKVTKDQSEQPKSILKKNLESGHHGLKSRHHERDAPKACLFSRIMKRLRRRKSANAPLDFPQLKLKDETNVDGTKVEYRHILVPSPTLQKLQDEELDTQARSEVATKHSIQENDTTRDQTILEDNSPLETDLIEVKPAYRFPYASSKESEFTLDKDNTFDAPKLNEITTRSSSNDLLIDLKENPQFSHFLSTYLYTDGEKNWTTITKLELGQEINSEISILKQMTDMDTEDVIEIDTSGSVYSEPNLNDVIAVAERFDDVVCELPSIKKSSEALKLSRDVSSHSLTPSLAAYELGQAMNFNFSAKNLALLSSDEEYFSTDERSIVYDPQNSPASACFSDDTIVIDSQPPKVDDAATMHGDESGKAESSTGMPKSETFYLGNFDSIAYLSKLLSNT